METSTAPSLSSPHEKGTLLETTLTAATNTSSTLNQQPSLPSMLHSPSITGVDEFDQQAWHQQQQQGTTPVVSAKNEGRLSPGAQPGRLNIASQGLGARVLFATDEWFASADRLLLDGPPHFDPDAYCEQGKVMDGWESRRRREAGHDWCVIKLAGRGRVRGLEIDTAHFTGNHVPAISLQVADITDSRQETAMVAALPGALERLLYGSVQGTGASPEEVEQAEAACRVVAWRELLPRTKLRPGYEDTRLHYYAIETPVEATHVRVNYYPDGGVARLRLWAEPLPNPKPLTKSPYVPIQTGATCTVVEHHHSDPSSMPSQLPYEFPELSSDACGGWGLTCSNQHYGQPSNLLQSTLGRDMGDGWETARHPNRPAVLVRHPATQLVDSPLSDWCILKLGRTADQGVARIILDTRHFRGNYPESVLVEGCCATTDEAVLEAANSSNNSHHESIEGTNHTSTPSNLEWFTLVPRGRMAPDSEHVYDRSLSQIQNGSQPVSHVRVSIFPDGGLSRVRVYG